MMYLIFPTEAAAMARSQAAWQGAHMPELPGLVTRALWTWRVHPEDGRAALEIPDTPAQAGLGLTQEAYEALLTAAERAALVGDLPGDWAAEVE